MKISYIGILSGFALGVLAPLLVWQGNPGNMGMCAACFIRDTSGALGFGGALAYIRPDIIGIVLGAFIAALFFWQKSGFCSVAAIKTLIVDKNSAMM